MKKSANTMEVKVERLLETTPKEAFNGWLNPKICGNPWFENDKIILQPKLNGLFYWSIRGNHHYGRFTKLDRAKKIQHTWMSPSTLGQESLVTVTFKKKGDQTLMTLVHSGLPKADVAKNHIGGWNYFLDNIVKYYGK